MDQNQIDNLKIGDMYIYDLLRIRLILNRHDRYVTVLDLKDFEIREITIMDVTAWMYCEMI